LKYRWVERGERILLWDSDRYNFSPQNKCDKNKEEEEKLVGFFILFLLARERAEDEFSLILKEIDMWGGDSNLAFK
jgi:hypothetical protein